MTITQVADVIIIGSGLAGLMAAEILSTHKNVIIITKSNVECSNSSMAQGGIAAAIDKEDSWSDHFFDTIVAGSFHNNEAVTKLLVQKGPEMIEKLIELGVNFDRDNDGNYSLGKEGAHQRRRILHAGGDATGKELVTKLIERVKKHTTIIEHETAIDLLVSNTGCYGVITHTQNEQEKIYLAPHTILATGGAGQLYEVTSNCEQVTGDGMALAYRAGALLADMEFIQFHPTMLVKDGKAYGLVSEAVRGEGARLLTEQGTYLMDGKHEQMDLAPRDVVARAIFEQLSLGKPLFLDISSIPDFQSRFPSVTELCIKAGLEIEDGRIPVAPGAHFMMGGVVTDEQGQTTVPGLYAIGEVARTGVHGANRLASNSLLEGIVFASELASFILSANRLKAPLVVLSNRDELKARDFELPNVYEIQGLMSQFVGIVRNKQGLETALQWVKSYEKAIWNNQEYRLKIDEKTICNMLTVCYFIISAALERTESRGGHFRSDAPQLDSEWLQKSLYWSNRQTNPVHDVQLKDDCKPMVGVKS
ncbi:L-aspartate oxidase [Bacillus alkalicellulosilyticus]|uniref:L-aspartate oxidase n=1 Tax=Alkalihalobacterium alkalicellulosilyticum TaxID=1912214 RepID=UPI0009964A99|nr:L-aspartate oxidase [Bacillus alkalicellulosilyticus]